MLGLRECLLIVAAGIFLATRYMKRRRNFPPGPRGLPLLGNMLQFANQPHKKLFGWAERYGRLFTINLLTEKVVIVNDYKLAKEILLDNDFAGRPKNPAFEILTEGPHGIIFTEGKHWEEQRRWSLRNLKDFGFGKASMEGIIMDEVNDIVDYFKGRVGTPITIKDRFNIATLSSIWSLLSGNRMKHDDPRLNSMMKAFEEVIPVVTQSGIMFAFWIRHIRRGAYKQVLTIANTILDFVKESASDHWNTHHEGTSRDFIDEYISEIKKTTDPSSSFYKDLGRKNLIGLLVDMVQAGAETTSNSIMWAVCYLSHFPEVQKKMQEELTSVLGHRPVTLSDKPLLPYTEAVILETLRYSPIFASGVMHAPFVDKVVEGYDIPAGTVVLTNIYYIHHNPTIWGDPENFRPERFLSADGTKIVKNEHLIPFQVGRRQCLGETVARDSLFLYLSTIFQKFEISKVEKEMPQAQNSFLLMPHTYNFIFKSRE